MSPLARNLPQSLDRPWAALACRLVLAGVLLASGFRQASFPVEFAGALAAYQLAPEAVVQPLAVYLPWLQLVCGALLLAGVRVKAAALTAATLLAVFVAAMVSALWRDLPIACGCPGFQDAPLGPAALAVGLGCLGLTLYVFLFDRRLQLERWLEARRAEGSGGGED